MDSTMTRTLPANIDHPLPLKTYEVVRVLLVTYFRSLHFVRVRGAENIPTTGPVIVAPNHLSYYDPTLVGLGIPRQVRTMAWNALFRVPLLGWAMRKLGAFAVDPENPDTAAYKQSLLLLRHGHCVVIFPEGRRGHDGLVQPFETGVARLALRSGAAIVPAALTGLLEAWPRWRLLPRLFRPLQVKFYPPVYPPQGEFRGDELRLVVEQINEQVRRPIERRYRAHQRLRQRQGKPLALPPPR